MVTSMRGSRLAQWYVSDRRWHVWIVPTLAGLLACLGTVFATQDSAAATTCPNAVLRAGVSAALPDCRAYEQVSPTEKGGFAAYPTQVPPVQSLTNGEKLTYLSLEAFPGALGNTALYAAHTATRAASGWETTELTPEIPPGATQRLYEASYWFSDDLSQAAIRVPLVQLTPNSTPNAYNLFLRHPDGKLSLINDAKPMLSTQEYCEQQGFELSICFEVADISTFAGASTDFSHVLFESNGQLTPEAPETGIESLYENVGGKVSLVGILPDGSPAANSTAGAGSRVGEEGTGSTDSRVEHAISKDGSRVVFQAPADGGSPDSEQNGLLEVYDRINGEETVELSAPAPGAEPSKCEVKTGTCNPEPATFWEASEDGSRVFFTSAAELTEQSRTNAEGNGEDEDLYEYDVPARTLRDLTIDTNPVDKATGAMVQGVVDSSQDGSYVYFVAKGELVPGKGVDGQPNLYVTHDGEPPTFIATLSGSGTCNFNITESADACDWTQHVPESEAYVTPDGLHVAFMSTMSIPTASFPAGYNNIDRNTELPDSEVYEYSAANGQLVCASCASSGQPEGNALIGGIDLTEVPVGTRQPYKGISTSFYRARALNDSGTRLFYSAPVALAGPSDKVFEYEQKDEGTCELAAGCQYQISGPGHGESQTDQFVGASSSGNDVFFATEDRLFPADRDNVTDIYDARVGGGFATPSTEVPCGNVCRQLAPVNGGLPLQSGSNGPSGNLIPPAATAPKPLTRAQMLARALKSCRAKKRNKHKRASCEASARHRFGIKAKAKRSKATRRAK
jgi:hypothetical protein